MQLEASIEEKKFACREFRWSKNAEKPIWSRMGSIQDSLDIFTADIVERY